MAKSDELPLWPSQAPLSRGMGDVFQLPEQELDALAAALAKRAEVSAVVLLPTLKNADGTPLSRPDWITPDGHAIDVIASDARVKRAFVRARQAEARAARAMRTPAAEDR